MPPGPIRSAPAPTRRREAGPAGAWRGRAAATLWMIGFATACALPPLAPPQSPWSEPGQIEPQRPPLVEQPASDLPPPGGLRAHSGAFRRIPLQWDPMLDLEVGGYLVEVADAADGFFAPLVPVWGRGHLAIVAGEPLAPLGDGETRYFRLRAFAPDGRLSPQASTVVVATTAPLPDAPIGLRAYSRQPREVPLAWRVSEDASVEGYRLERSPGKDGPWQVVAELTDRYQTSFVDEGLGDLRVFYYRVAARNAGGAVGPESQPVRAVTKPKPLPPLDLRLERQGLGVNQLGWEPNVEPDILEYRLYREEPEGQQLIASAPREQQRIVDTTVRAGEPAVYTLVAVDRTGLTSRSSNVVRADGVGYGLEVTPRPDGVQLEWDPRSDEDFVRARIERAGWFAVEIMGVTGEGVFVDRDVEPGDRFYYRVILERADGSEAPPSQALEVTVPE
jgi:fibronectin type 3 domain-containing protein